MPLPNKLAASFQHGNHCLELFTRSKSTPYKLIINNAVVLETFSFSEARQRFEKAVNRSFIGGYASI